MKIEETTSVDNSADDVLEKMSHAARMFRREVKQCVHIRLDPSVIRWFKSYGPGYQTRINEILKEFVSMQEGNK